MEEDTSEWAVGAFWPKEVGNQSPEFLTKLAKDIATNLVFTDRHIQKHDITQSLSMVFMPIVMGAFAETTKEYREDIGMVYEYWDKAGPRSINGYPCFFSLNILSVHDAEIVWDKVRKIEAVMDGV